MSIVTLVSGGLDSTLMATLAADRGVKQYPLFVNYGQRARAREHQACIKAMEALGLGEPTVANVRGYGRLIKSGLTDQKRHVAREAFTPGRNALFLLLAASYAATVAANTVAIGLLDERARLFPDQSSRFLSAAQEFLSVALGIDIAVIAPLMGMTKRQVMAIAQERGITGTYSCHVGGPEPCGECIACREFNTKEE